MIFYFSGTGNSQFVAEILSSPKSEKVISISDCMKNNEYSFEADEEIGFVVPVYFYGMPSIVLDFLSKLELLNTSDSYIYLVMTMGGSTGNASAYFRKALNKRGYVLSAIYSVKMPDNYIPMFKMPSDEQVMETISKSENSVLHICDAVRIHDTGNFNKARGVFPVTFSAVAYSMYKNARKTNKFVVDSQKCSECGKCERICPVGAIEINDGKPVWIKEKCTLCLGCLQRCPTAAIDYGKKTVNKKRYVNPKIKELVTK